MTNSYRDSMFSRKKTGRERCTGGKGVLKGPRGRIYQWRSHTLKGGSGFSGAAGEHAPQREASRRTHLAPTTQPPISQSRNLNCCCCLPAHVQGGGLELAPTWPGHWPRAMPAQNTNSTSSNFNLQETRNLS